jgi:hypothetical protein
MHVVELGHGVSSAGLSTGTILPKIAHLYLNKEAAISALTLVPGREHRATLSA